MPTFSASLLASNWQAGTQRNSSLRVEGRTIFYGVLPAPPGFVAQTTIESWDLRANTNYVRPGQIISITRRGGPIYTTNYNSWDGISAWSGSPAQNYDVTFYAKSLFQLSRGDQTYQARKHIRFVFSRDRLWIWLDGVEQEAIRALPRQPITLAAGTVYSVLMQPAIIWVNQPLQPLVISTSGLTIRVPSDALTGAQNLYVSGFTGNGLVSLIVNPERSTIKDAAFLRV